MNASSEPTKIDRQAHSAAGGVILIVIGISVLLSRWLDLGVYLLLLLGLGMLAWGMFSRSAGWLIAGSILTGIGTGVLVFNGPWQIAEQFQPGIFLLCFALGWFLIPVLTRLFSPRTHWWAFIPGGIMAAIGCVLLLVRGSLQEDVANLLQGTLLILAGLYLVLRRKPVQKG